MRTQRTAPLSRYRHATQYTRDTARRGVLASAMISHARSGALYAAPSRTLGQPMYRSRARARAVAACDERRSRISSAPLPRSSHRCLLRARRTHSLRRYGEAPSTAAGPRTDTAPVGGTRVPSRMARLQRSLTYATAHGLGQRSPRLVCRRRALTRSRSRAR